MKNLSIGARLMAGFAAVLVLIAGTAAITVNGFRKASMHYEAALDACSHRATAGMELEVALLGQIKAQKNYLLRADAAYLREAERDGQKVRAALARLQGTSEGASEEALLIELAGTLDALDQAFEAHVGVREAGDLEAADRMMQGKATAVAGILNEIVAAAQRQASDERASAIESVKRTRLITLGLIGCVGVLAVVIGGVLSLSMTRPLRRLQSQIQTVGAGGEAPSAPAAEGRNEIAAIAGAFHELVHKAALLQQMEIRSKRLIALSSRTAQAQEEERERIARELHDSLGQALTAIKLDLSSAAQALGGSCPAGRDHLSRARSVADQSLDELRRLVFDLRPPALDTLGLVAALESYCRDLGRRSGLAVAIDADAMQSRLPADVETALYRICQEALTNVWRHASATSALVRLTWTADAVTLAISDDGAGFDTAAVIPTNGTLGGVGLLSMERRAEDLGGSFRLESKLGEGTRVSVTIPCRAQRGA